MRTVLMFKSSALNTTVRKGDFINDCCYGDDPVAWFIKRLRTLGVGTDAKPAREDCGWYFGFGAADGRHLLALGYRPDEPRGDWICFVERDKGFFESLFGGRERVTRGAVEAIDAETRDVSEPSGVRWFTRTGFDSGELDPSPTSWVLDAERAP